MKKTITLSAIIILLSGISLHMNAQDITSQTAKEIIPAIRFGNNISVKFGGFVRAEYYVDSREMVGAVEDLFGFFPENNQYGADGKDLNDVVRQNISTQATRFNTLLTGPDFLKAKSTAFIEYDFSGGGNVNLRLRQAWIKLNWQRAEILIGKTWNPLSEIPFPSVAGLHTGIPFRPFGRGDQLRFTFNLSQKLSLLLAGEYQSEHKSPIESNAASDVRSNPIPELHFQIRYKSKSFSSGIISEYKTVRPATKTTGTLGTFKTTQTISSYALGLYWDYRISLFNIKGSALYAQNLSELFQQGGYAVKTLNTETGARTYSPSESVSGWVNLVYGRKWQVALFGGYQKNLGFTDNILSDGAFFGRWQNVAYIYRIAPSIKYSYKQWQFQLEADYDVAAYGTVDYADKGKVRNAEEVAGVRGIFATTFFF